MTYPNPFLSLEFHRNTFVENMDSASNFYRQSHIIETNSMGDVVVDAGPGDPEYCKQVRGLTMLLMYASYEKLIYSINTSILEAANRCRVSFARLSPEMKHFALIQKIESIRQVSQKKLHHEAIPELIELINGQRMDWEISTNFPDTGTFMDQFQLTVWWKSLGLEGDPASYLRRTFNDLKIVRENRNAIAHGRLTAEEVGKLYTPLELYILLESWRSNWLAFIDEIDRQCCSVDFFRR